MILAGLAQWLEGGSVEERLKGEMVSLGTQSMGGLMWRPWSEKVPLSPRE